jgi:two-component system cell cycle sensor histidine kinase/response regulator CckA
MTKPKPPPTTLDQRTDSLAPSADGYRLVFDRNPSPMWVFDLDTHRFLAVNAAAVVEYGYPPELFLSLTVRDVYGEVDRPRFEQALMTDAQELYAGSWVHRRRDGTLLHVDIRSNDLQFENRRARLIQATNVTEQVRVESARRDGESRKTAILDSVLDCIITMDAQGLVIEFNAAAERTFGYTKAQAVGRPLADLIIPPALRGAHAAGLTRYLATKDGPVLGKAIEITAIRSDGSELPVELAITVIYSETAPIFTGVLRDITARKRADETRARLAAIVDSSDDAIISTGMDGTILTWNAGAERLYGYTANEMIGRDRGRLVPPGMSDELAPVMARAARGEAGEPLETRRIRKDGTAVDISLVISPMADPGGRVTSMSTIARDITSRKKAEASLREERERVRAAEERTRFALEAARVGIWEMDFATRTLRWSAILEAQHGLAPGTFAGTLDALIALIHPEDRAAMLDAMTNANQSGADFSVHYRAVWRDGTVRWLNGTGRVHLGDRGESPRALGITQDVTERRTLEQQYRQAQKMEAIGQLAGGVAHDFNNLLTVILGNCGLLLDGLETGDHRQADLTEIQKAGMSAALLTRQLLAFSRKEIIEPKLLDLNVVLANMRAMLRRLIREDVEVVLSLRSELAPIQADRGQIEQIVLNLAVNARDAMPQGGILTIEIANIDLGHHYAKTHVGVSPGAYVALTVTDTGAGMTPEVQAHLFEPFFTTKAVGIGTGLGLATVHGIVAQSRGSIEVSSEIGSGTTFKVYFPRADATGALTDVPPVIRPLAKGETVLVVEDADGLRVLTTKLLERLGYKVLVAAGADRALQLFEEHPSIDLLLTDVVMPGGNGAELAKRLVERRPALRVVYMSGYTDDAIVHHGVLDPGIAFLHKPFTSDTLAHKIREALDG